MNTTEFLQNRGWKLYRTRFEGKQAQWVSPYDGQIYQQRGAYSDENLYGHLYHGRGSWVNCSQGRIWVRSSWEAAVVRYLDEKKYHWAFEPKTFSITYEHEGEQVLGTYRPDFYVEQLGLYLEVKGYWREIARAKFEAFKREYPELAIEIWDGKLLKERGIYERYKRNGDGLR